MTDFLGELVPILVVGALGWWALHRSGDDNKRGMLGDLPANKWWLR